MTSPHNFSSDWDYFDSLLTPTQRKVRDILEDDPVGWLMDHDLTDDFFKAHWEDIWDFAIDKGYVEEYIENYVKGWEEF